ncbi:protein-L-isoaspartate O-methyltransferase family protein [Marinibacterium profundimaris]|uniref:Protein-L-isoaspartate O-methyltransferase n=1 Tax=Marinibacterium profundimaris TaxID=1679460 RepID=A0A225NFY0_9RHOB|nr:protein-L-isoaspartate O-methyltransferase [Marinibacterium profundimaris]OWU72449.1 protein-L-isoaspartate O-methyltransferase [Marinibacterium profundimaris]
MTDFEARRRMMVDTQVRPSDVTRFPIIDAMLTVPRETFVPDAFRETAYVGEHIPLGRDRVVMDPRVLAMILDKLDLTGDDLVLDLGSAYGYSAAVIAHIAQAVIAVEGDEDLASESQGLLSDYGADNVIVEQGDMAAGAPEHGPYDVIIVEGGVEAVPAALTDQLKEGGRMAAIFVDGALGVMRVGHKHNGKMTWRDEFNAGVPVMPGFAKETAFSL